MAKRTKPIEPDLPVLPAQPLEHDGGQRSDRPAAPAQFREYIIQGEMMRVSRFDLLAVEFAGLTEADLPFFQETLSIHTRGWMILCHLFGIIPVIPRKGTAEDDLRTWSREELQSALGINAKQLGEELDKFRGLWAGCRQLVKPPEALPAAASKDELAFEADALVAAQGMTNLLQRDEVPWMAGRLQACGPMLHHSQVGELMRMTLLTELDLRRLHNRMALTSKNILDCTDGEKRLILEREYDWIFKKRTSLMSVYQEQLADIDKINPFMKTAAGSMTMKGVFSDAVACHHEWYSRGTNQLRDGIFTAAEIEILMRTSVQSPVPQYRLSVVVYLNQARAHLFSGPDIYKGEFSPLTCKKMDAAFTAAAMAISQSEGERLTDLLSDDPVLGEYAEIKAES